MGEREPTLMEWRIEQVLASEIPKHGTFDHYVDNGASWGRVVQVEGQIQLRTLVREIIQAMREPTAAMELAADNLHPGSGAPYEPGSPREVWQAMIDDASPPK